MRATPGPVLPRWTTDGPFGVPRGIWVLLLVDALLGIVYLIDAALGRPGGSLSDVIDLDGEANLPTWFASVQWFAVAATLFFFVDRRVERRDRRSWALWALPLVFLAFSADEVVQGHEFAGVLTDTILPGGTRAGSAVPVTGVFGASVGLPVIIAFIVLFTIVRPYLRVPSGAFLRIGVGLSLVLLGAIGFDFLANFLQPGSAAATVEIYIEESLELVGATIVLWGAWLLATH